MDKIVRVDVDTQHGFCNKDGGLYVNGANCVTSLVAHLNHEAEEKGYVLIGSVDTHSCHDPEFENFGGIWPVHCVKGTWDWLKVPETLPSDFHFVSMNGSIPSDTINKCREGKTALYFEKNVYSLFDNWIAESYIASLYEKGFHTFEVYGVATDYCVKAAALGIAKMLRNRQGGTVRLLLYACAGVAEDTTKAAIEEMRAAGIEIVEAP